MKKNILLAAAAFATCSSVATAQEVESTKLASPISKGHITIGAGIGGTSLAYGKGVDGKNLLAYSVSLNPSAGYFLTDHWMVSAELIGSLSGVTRRNQPNSQSAGIGLAGRYYFGKPEDSKGRINRFRLFAEAGGSYERLWATGLYNNVPEHYTDNASLLKAGVGFNYLLNQNVAFETGISGRQLITGDRNYRNSYSSLRLELGVRVFLNRKH